MSETHRSDHRDQGRITGGAEILCDHAAAVMAQVSFPELDSTDTPVEAEEPEQEDQIRTADPLEAEALHLVLQDLLQRDTDRGTTDFAQGTEAGDLVEGGSEFGRLIIREGISAEIQERHQTVWMGTKQSSMTGSTKIRNMR